MAKLDTPWKAKVLTLFPEMFPGTLGLSLAGQGLKDGTWSLEAMDIRDFAPGKHRSVDGAPFGGGPGMVMRPDVVSDAIEAATRTDPALALIYLTPRGRPLDQARVRQLAVPQHLWGDDVLGCPLAASRQGPVKPHIL